MSSQVLFVPVAAEGRVDSLDMIRGFAVLGILLMNIQSYSMPDAAYMNPLAYGDFSSVNAFSWALVHIFVSQKFSALFSLLFGAGIYLFMRSSNGVAKPMSLHYRRMMWLLIFGLAHFYLLWWGDILMVYALAGCQAILFRNASSRVVLVAAAIFLLIGMCEEVDLFERLIEGEKAYVGFAEAWLPSREELADEIALFHTSGWWEQVVERHGVMAGYFTHGPLTAIFLVVIVARFTGLMLIGMLLFRSGYLLAQRSSSDYWRLVWLAGLPGLVLTLLNLVMNARVGFTAEYNYFWGRMLDYLAPILLVLGYIGIFYLVVLSRHWLAAQRRLQAVGKLAFTNYLSQSLICTALFYGFGAGLFGQVSRVVEFGVAVAVIALQLWWSPLILQHWRFGPMEWLWRSLTYWQLQPLRRHASVSVDVSQ